MFVFETWRDFFDAMESGLCDDASHIFTGSFFRDLPLTAVETTYGGTVDMLFERALLPLHGHGLDSYNIAGDLLNCAIRHHVKGAERFQKAAR